MLDQFLSQGVADYLCSCIDIILNNFYILHHCSLCLRLVLKLPSIRRKTKPLRLPFACRLSSRLQFVPTLWASFTTKWPKTIVNHMPSTVMLVSWKIIVLVIKNSLEASVTYSDSGSQIDLKRLWPIDRLQPNVKFIFRNQSNFCSQLKWLERCISTELAWRRQPKIY